MSINIIADILNSGPYFRGRERATFIALANFSDHAGRCWPSMDALAFTSGNSVRQVRRDLASLEAIGMLERELGGGRLSTRYAINVEALEDLAGRLNSVKASAKKDNRDRYQAVSIEARRLRQEDDDLFAVKNASRGDSLSPLDEKSEVVEIVESGRAPRTGCPPCPDRGDRAPRTGWPGTPDTVSPKPLIEPLKKPSLEPASEASAIGANATPIMPAAGAIVDNDPRKAFQETRRRIGRTAEALGMSAFQFTRIAGNSDAADQFARKFEGGEIDLKQLAAALAGNLAGYENKIDRAAGIEIIDALTLMAYALIKAASVEADGRAARSWVGRPELRAAAA